jgi:hypothetical protein
MADKTPVRVVFNSDSVATGMAEFQTGESVPVANGGTGLTAVGSAGQVLKVNGAGNGLEFGAEGDISITNLVAPTNADLTLTTSGTGNIILDAITFRGTTISSTDSTIININEGVVVDGTFNSSGQATLSGLAYPTSDGTVGQFLKTDGSGTLAFADLSLGDLTIIGSTISVPSNADLTLDPAGTGAIKLNANTDITGNLTVTGTLDLGDSNFTNVGSLQLDSIAGDGDTNTSITFSGSDVITIATGGSGRLTVGDGALSPVTDSQIDLGTSSLYYKDAYIDSITTTGNVSIGGNLDVTGTLDLSDSNFTNVGSLQLDSIAGDGDTNTSITFSGSDIITVATGGSTAATFNADQTTTFSGAVSGTSANFDGGVTIDNITIDGQEIDVSSGNLTLDVAGDINLNADGGDILIIDGATTVGTISMPNNNLDIRARVSDKDLVFKGNDGGSEITALTLDMSEAGAATFNSTVTLGTNKAIQFVDANESVKSDGTNLILTSGGTAFKMPTADGDSGDFLKTDGSGTMSFASSVATASDDTRAVVKNNKSVSTSARTVDYFQSTSADLAWYFVALNDLTNDHSSASCFAVAHNNTDAFISGARGGASGSDNSLPTTSADISSGQVRVKITAPSADSKISYYKIPISRANTANETAGVTITTSNTDVDSASESIDTFAHASFRAAKYLIIIDDNAKTETGATEALVVHDGTNAFVTQHGTINTGNNDMITLSAAISGSNVVVSAAGLTPNLSLKIHKTLLADSMTAVSNANQKIIGATTISSSATTFDSFDLDDATAAMYYVVGGNSTEGHYSVQEVYCSGAPGEASVSQGPFVSTKGTVQLEFTAEFDADQDNTLQMSVSSTSGGSTVVNAYRINCLAE